MRTITLTIESNRKTCGECHLLERRSAGGVNSGGEWHCRAFNQSRGWVGAQKTPNRSEECLRAELLPPR